MSLTPLNARQRQKLRFAMDAYQAQLPNSPGMEYLLSRGLDAFTIADFKLGYVETPITDEHDQFQGMVHIPNLCAAEDQHPVGSKYRAVNPEARLRYNQPSGQVSRLFNLRALNDPGDTIYVTEGEFDCIALGMLGLPAIGVPGTNSWGRDNAYRNRLLEGRKVVLCRDSDQAGEDLVNAMREVDGLEVRKVTPHKDANDFLLKEGPQALWERVTGVDDPDS